MKAEKVTIFTDGSSRGNPGPGGWAAIVVSEAAETSGKAGKVKELGGREAHTTNNRMELSAAMEALRFVAAMGKGSAESIIVYTDSKYLINGVTKWIAGWKQKGWKTMAKKDVENRDLWEGIDMSVQKIEGSGEKGSHGKIAWKYVAGHSDIPANERCDVIATTFADDQKIDLYDGPLSGYSIDTKRVVIAEGTVTNKSSKERSKLKAFSYLSLVDGVAMRHATWPECEARVKGISGVKFKKSISASDEAAILKEWGAEIK